MVSEEERVSMSRALFLAYYEDQMDREIIFDTNRLWCGQLPALGHMFPKALVLTSVRNMGGSQTARSVSFERIGDRRIILFYDLFSCPLFWLKTNWPNGNSIEIMLLDTHIFL